MSSFLLDLRYAFRTFVRSPGFAFIAVVTLALGIGANTAIFSVVDSVLLRPLPYPGSDRLIVLDHLRKGDDRGSFSFPDFSDFRSQAKSLSQLTGFHDDGATLTGRGAPKRFEGLATTANFFDVFGVTPMFGRGFAAGEDEPGKEHVVVLSNATWKKHFGGDGGVVGTTITLDQTPYTVVGVMPASFRIVGAQELDYFVPMPRPFDAPFRPERGAHFITAYGRLAPGATVEQASAEVETIAQRLAVTYPDKSANRTARVTALHDVVVKELRPALLLLLGAVAFVLLIACANVANLLLARATVRQRELAIRFALGASRSRVVRQMLTESVLLALFGGTLGVVLAVWGLDSLRAILPEDLTHVSTVAIDGRVLVYTIAISLVTGVVFGILPALHGAASSPNDALKEGARGTSGVRQRARSVLVAAEVAVAMLLLIGAGLTLRSFGRLTTVDPGFNPRDLLMTNVMLPEARYSDDAKIDGFYQALKSQIGAIPGVSSAALGFPLPYTQSNISLKFNEVGAPPPEPGKEPISDFAGVNADFAKALELPIRRGRFFAEADDHPNAAQVMVVNEAFVRKFFAGKDVIGKQIVTGWKNNERPREIVGVVGDAHTYALDKEAGPQIYVPFAQASAPYIVIAARTTATAGFATTLQKSVESIDGDQPIDTVEPMTKLIGTSMEKQRLSTMLLGIFGAVALILALIGVYGVMSYTVTQRVREIGVRMALGARPGNVTWMVVRSGVLLALIGVAAGVVAALFVGRLMANMLYGITATDPVTYGAMAALLIGVTALATWIPARRAARVDPMIALRSE